ncbi:unnamed protein product [Psylliodes chrysocephalus]|uniref:Uncharacterized protein n=1 Tax=Psylliodes chrysocephalus TaxID=3402493 RepID=A0A9P0D5U9_9CUCU|nr:unnamed protein product [Psylliodes chrysocephala]
MNSIETLLEAAEYIARREREAEHGYASTLRFPDELRSVSKRPKTKKSQGNRTSHNELEKNSRKTAPNKIPPRCSDYTKNLIRSPQDELNTDRHHRENSENGFRRPQNVKIRRKL